MKMSNPLKDAFKKRYNRDIEIDVTENFTDRTSLKIKSKKKTELLITEYRKEGLTDYVTVQFGDKTHRYSRYIDAEVFVADMIGEEEK